MNRKQKIIVSITGIFLVLMILVGLTYAYFLTKITGNTNTKSISVTTANLVLEYGENTNVVQGIENAEPGYSVEKIFTATNKGNSTVTYGAALESIVNELSRQEDLVYTLTCTSYLKEGFSLASDGTITGTVDGTCNGVTSETKFPSTSNLSIIVNNTIDTTHTHAYKLTVTYKEMNIDQSEDMNKTFSAKVNIVDLNAVARNNPYEDNKNSLAYNIINNAMNKTNGTELVGIPKTIPAAETSGKKYYTDKVDEAISEESISISTTYQSYYWTYGTGYTIDEDTGKFTLTGVSTCKYNDETCSAALVGKYLVASSAYSNSSSSDTKKRTTNLLVVYKVTEAPVSSTSTITMKAKIISSISYSTEKELSLTNDDYGISYYYRGGVEDNYVNFAGMCWKIVRIEGDGSTKLILEDRSVECNSSSYTGNWSDGNTIAFGYDSNNKADFLNYSGGLADSLESFQTTLGAKVGTGKTLSDYLKVDDWCYDYNVAATNSSRNQYYGAYKRIYTDKSPSLKCTGTKLNKFKDNTDMYVATLTADEMSFAGATRSTNYTLYLMNSYAQNNDLNWWGMSPEYYYADAGYDLSFLFSSGGYFLSDNVKNKMVYNHLSRPSITLKTNIQISSGNGTKSNPYTFAD